MGRSTSPWPGGVVTVRDHGPGIDAGDLPHVFDRFYRAPAARSMPGSGLGLAIVRQVMEVHGGTATVEQPTDGGTLFRLEFPPPTSEPTADHEPETRLLVRCVHQRVDLGANGSDSGGEVGDGAFDGTAALSGKDEHAARNRLSEDRLQRERVRSSLRRVPRGRSIDVVVAGRGQSCSRRRQSRWVSR